MKDEDGDEGVVQEMDVDEPLADDRHDYPAAELGSQVFDPNASVYMSETANETMSDAFDGGRTSQWTIPPHSPSPKIGASPTDIGKEHGGESNRAVELLRALLANNEFVTQPDLLSLLRQAGCETHEDMVEEMVKDLQSMGILGSHTRGKGTLQVDWHEGTHFGCCGLSGVFVPRQRPRVRPEVRFSNASRSARYFFAPTPNVFHTQK